MKHVNTSSDIEAWRAWHAELISLINGEFPSRALRCISEIVRPTAFGMAAREMVHCVGHISPANRDGLEIEVALPACQMNVPSVIHMAAWLRRHLASDLHAAVLHGSLGTNEVVTYSDFDALVIIKDEVLHDATRLARVAWRLYQARRFMYEQDPLQHHGWFVLPEQALRAWPEDYLPVAVLKHACELMQTEPHMLQLNPVMERSRSTELFFRLATGVERELNTGACFTDLYRFKSMLSKVLLLPTVYIQVRDNVGVFKRDSFEMARLDFPAKDWEAIKTASDIRRDWSKVPAVSPRVLAQHPGNLGNLWRWSRRKPIPPNLQDRFGVPTRQAMLRLMRGMTEHLTHAAK